MQHSFLDAVFKNKNSFNTTKVKEHKLFSNFSSNDEDLVFLWFIGIIYNIINLSKVPLVCHLFP
jgi:hypothetical protein